MRQPNLALGPWQHASGRTQRWRIKSVHQRLPTSDASSVGEGPQGAKAPTPHARMPPTSSQVRPREGKNDRGARGAFSIVVATANRIGEHATRGIDDE